VEFAAGGVSHSMILSVVVGLIEIWRQFAALDHAGDCGPARARYRIL